jgi:hypothetical protein
MSTLSDLSTYLIAQGIVGGSTEWAIKHRRTMDSPVTDQLVTLIEDGGPPPEISTATGIGDEAQHDIGVLVTIRGNAWKGDTNYTKAMEIFDELHGKRDITLVSKLYLRIRAMTPEPVFLGFDDQGRPRHTIAFLLLADA